MEDFLKEIKNREEFSKFIKSRIEDDNEKLYTKNYNVDFLVEDLLQNRLSEVVLHFKNRIDESQVKMFSQEFASAFSCSKSQIESYTQKNSLDFLLEK